MNWKVIEEYPNYAISNCGSVKSLRYDRILKMSLSNSGYGYVALTKDALVRTISVHSLVMKYFGITKPGENFVIDHKNGDKTDNRINNLEWVSVQLNTLRGYGNLDLKKKICELHTLGKSYKQIAEELDQKYQFVRMTILKHLDLLEHKY